MVSQRKNAISTQKLDRTFVSDVDTHINADFIKEVKARSGNRASVIGEEESAKVEGSGEIWIIDPVDGTHEYIDTTVKDSERTSCVGAALIKNGVLQLSVVLNPYRNELFVADRDLGATYLNSKRLNLRKGPAGNLGLGRGIPYDYAHWNGAKTDPRFFEHQIGRQPLGSFSAIYQACTVAKGESVFDVFVGDTIHDIAPSALLVELAGGTVSDIKGRALRWDDLNGAVYSNGVAHDGVVRALASRPA